jgi:predicted Zn-dependent peptidase
LIDYLAVIKVEFIPMYNRSVLDNGLTVITKKMPNSHSISVAFLIGTGSCYESPGEEGISHFIEHMCFKGTIQRPTAMHITREIEGVGGIINASTDKESTIFWCKAASKHFPLILDVLADLLLNSQFNTEELRKECSVIIEEINMNLDLPQQRVNMLIDELLWPDQVLGKEITGSKAGVSSLTREQLLSYISRRYVPNNTVVSIAGNIEHEQVISQLKLLLDTWPAKDASRNYISDDTQFSPRLRIETRAGEQTHLCLAVHGFSYSHTQRFALGLLNTVLGGGMSSRLFIEIRERRGLAYDISSYVEHFLNSGSLVVYAGIDPNNTQITTESILEQLSSLKRGIIPDELDRARELSKGRLQLSLEDSKNVALWLGSQELLTHRIFEIDDIINIINAITIDNLEQVANELLSSDSISLAIVGPPGHELSIDHLKSRVI